MARKPKICMSINRDVLERFHGVCDEGDLKYSQVVESLMQYFVDLEAQVRSTPDSGVTIPTEGHP